MLLSTEYTNDSINRFYGGITEILIIIYPVNYTDIIIIVVYIVFVLKPTEMYIRFVHFQLELYTCKIHITNSYTFLIFKIGNIDNDSF